MEHITARVQYVMSHKNGYLVARVIPKGGNKRHPVCLKGSCDTKPLKNTVITAKGNWGIGRNGGDEFVAQEFESVCGFGWAIAMIAYLVMSLILIGAIFATFRVNAFLGYMEIATIITCAIACLMIKSDSPASEIKPENDSQAIVEYFTQLTAHNWWGRIEYKDDVEALKEWNKNQSALFNKAEGNENLEAVLKAFKGYYYIKKEFRGAKPELSMFVEIKQPEKPKSLLEMLEEVDTKQEPDHQPA